MPLEIALIGDFDPSITAHLAIPLALQHSAQKLNQTVQITWLATDSILGNLDTLSRFDGFWCVPGSPYRCTSGALAAIRFARENRIPFLGTCGGFQHALLEYAQNILGIADASHEETDPQAKTLLVSRLSCSLVEATGPVNFPTNSAMARIHGALQSQETYHCNYGLNPAFVSALFGGKDLIIAARDSQGDVRALKLTSHPFFFATLYQPERASLKGITHPLVTAFVQAASHHSTS